MEAIEADDVEACRLPTGEFTGVAHGSTLWEMRDFPHFQCLVLLLAMTAFPPPFLPSPVEELITSPRPKTIEPD
jgi:hypothetical protein